ncbi:MAG: nucleotidyltransferase domain-containing protein [Nanoarchaeota archaeon]|nr:nucleotidyltransferase domain-containing protein [Nanoarchaeota archaeon]
MFTKINVMELFMEDPQRKYHLREVAKILDISPRTAKKYLSVLKEERLVIVKREKIFENYMADTDSQRFRDNKVFYSAEKIKKSGLIKYLEEEMDYPTIILFGSVARGTDTKTSDIDIFIISENRAEPDIDRFEKILKRPIQIMVATKEDFKSGKNKELYNNVVNGVILSGFLEVF